MTSKFALVIANTDYEDNGLAQLTAPGRDAEDFAAVLKDQDICAFDQVNILLNQLSSTVTEAVHEFFDQKRPDDLLVMYFSGHGVRDEFGSLYFAVKNTIRSRLHSTAIRSDYIREAMERSRSKRLVLILECCNSGAFSYGSRSSSALGERMRTGEAFGFGGNGCRIILAATDSTQYAWEGNMVIGDTQNSLFTHFLINGLKGEADYDGDGKVSVDDLYDYAYEQVAKHTPRQTPSKWAHYQQGKIFLCENLKPRGQRSNFEEHI